MAYIYCIIYYIKLASYMTYSCAGQGGSYDSELMRVLRERDQMQGMLDKYERHLSEIQANVKVLTADRDKTSMHYQQVSDTVEGIAHPDASLSRVLTSVLNEWERLTQSNRTVLGGAYLPHSFGTQVSRFLLMHIGGCTQQMAWSFRH